MRFLIGAVTVVGCVVMALLALDLDRVRRIPWLRRKQEGENSFELRLPQKRTAVCSAVIGVLAAVCVWRLASVCGSTLDMVKLCIALVCVTGGACVDYIQHRIPNVFPLALSIASILLLAAGVIAGQDGALRYVYSSALSAVVTAVAMVAASLLTHRGIGAGDVKLMVGIALAGGVYIIGWTVFFAVSICALLAVFWLLTRKKDLKASVPFGPFLWIGYMTAIFLADF